MRLAIASLLALGWLCWPQVERQLPNLDDRGEYRIGVSQITINPPPRWVPVDLVERVFDRAGFDETLSLLDPSLSEKIALAFHTHPWIERLQQVKKSFPARVHVEVIYREPVAMVEVPGGGYLPIDKHGYLLPEKDFSTADIDRYPLIRDVASVPIGRGESWGDPAVIGAAQLASVLTRENEAGQSWWKTLGFKSIVAPRQIAMTNETDDLQYRLITKGKSEILWGRAPTTAHPAELTVDQKLERMAEYHRSYNGFDDAPAPFQIDIRHWQGTKRSLLATETPATSRQ